MTGKANGPTTDNLLSFQPSATFGLPILSPLKHAHQALVSGTWVEVGEGLYARLVAKKHPRHKRGVVERDSSILPIKKTHRGKRKKRTAGHHLSTLMGHSLVPNQCILVVSCIDLAHALGVLT